jgi:hypothetical protein
MYNEEKGESYESVTIYRLITFSHWRFELGIIWFFPV